MAGCSHNILQPKSAWGGKAYFMLSFQVMVHPWGKQAGIHGRNMRKNHGRMLLTGSLSSSYSMRFYTLSRPPFLVWEGHWLYTELSHPNHQLRQISLRHSRTPLWLRNSAAEDPSFQVTLGCVRLTLKTNQDSCLGCITGGLWILLSLVCKMSMIEGMSEGLNWSMRVNHT